MTLSLRLSFGKSIKTSHNLEWKMNKFLRDDDKFISFITLSVKRIILTSAKFFMFKGKMSLLLTHNLSPIAIIKDMRCGM